MSKCETTMCNCGHAHGQPCFCGLANRKDYDKTTLSPRQRTIRDAEEWLTSRCPTVPSEEVHKAAVRVANIVLGLHLNEDVARQYRGESV